MRRIEKIKVSPGVIWISIPEANLSVLCGCPADVVKHLIRTGLIKSIEIDGVECESGPNAILLSDVPVQNGEFSNLAEFPVLQMLYRQGLIIPNHPNNTGMKPLLLGRKAQVNAQMDYIYRGNYGLISAEEMRETGLDEQTAKDYFRLKLKFAFGAIKSTSDFIETKYIEDKQVEIQNGVQIKRIKLNIYEFEYKGEKTQVDINLHGDEVYEVPYRLGSYQVPREHFAVIHSGEGDGWDSYNPCMGSIIIYNGYVYLIDAHPNIKNTLNSLGISVSAVRGVFQTHAHDDHFSGLTSLIQSDHRIRYFSIPLVRKSVEKKLNALLGMDNILERFFDIHDLELGSWNDVEGLMVKPMFSPHPVENSIFLFRVIADKCFKTYYHMADISSYDVLKNMITDDPKAPGISQDFFDKIQKQYSIAANIKKIDIGGGMIHGQAIDFENDKSDRIVLSHTGRALSNAEKEIGQRASFGQVDVLIPSNSDQLKRYAKNYICKYYPDLDFPCFRDLLNCPVVAFNPGSILLKQGAETDYLFLSVTGTVEVIDSKKNIHQFLNSGSMVGEMSTLLNTVREKTYVALGYVNALKIPGNMYRDFVDRFNLMENIKRSRKNKTLLGNSWLFHEMASSPVINTISQKLLTSNIKRGKIISKKDNEKILFVLEGLLALTCNGRLIETLSPGDFCLEETILHSPFCPLFEIEALEDSRITFIHQSQIENVPAVMWKLFETHERRIDPIIGHINELEAESEKEEEEKKKKSKKAS